MALLVWFGELLWERVFVCVCARICSDVCFEIVLLVFPIPWFDERSARVTLFSRGSPKLLKLKLVPSFGKDNRCWENFTLCSRKGKLLVNLMLSAAHQLSLLPEVEMLSCQHCTTFLFLPRPWNIPSIYFLRTVLMNSTQEGELLAFLWAGSIRKILAPFRFRSHSRSFLHQFLTCPSFCTMIVPLLHVILILLLLVVAAVTVIVLWLMRSTDIWRNVTQLHRTLQVLWKTWVTIVPAK